MTIEDFKRPSHPDFMTSSELKAIGFSGLRYNSLSEEAEFWIKGNVEGRVSKHLLKIDPQAINKMIAEIIGVDMVMPDTPEAREYVKEKEKKDAFDIVVRDALPKKD